ncbi:MAG: GNAT family N-acetyltransferase [Lachnospiraceae bacterium]|nr:GNAT family N-acetyltransferase [Lachnospiraceae bacterium]
MTIQRIENITIDYYSHFCGIHLIGLKPGMYFICSADRDEILSGFGCKYTIHIFTNNDLCVVSYAPKYKDFMEQLKKCGRDEMILAVSRQFRLKKMTLMMFEKERVTYYGNARILKAADYPLYEPFFRAISPNANPDGWLYEYFIEKTEKEYFAGYFSDNKLRSVCDAPDMPYMEGKIQHTGINTLEGERRKGYAACTAALATHHLIEKGVCPQWECHAENTASVALAKSIGYKEYGAAYILEEWE